MIFLKLREMVCKAFESGIFSLPLHRSKNPKEKDQSDGNDKILTH